MPKIRYDLVPPKFFVGDTVTYFEYPKKVRNKKPVKKTGLIMRVKTVYFLKECRSIVQGTHLYNIKTSKRWIKENDIL